MIMIMIMVIRKHNGNKQEQQPGHADTREAAPTAAIQTANSTAAVVSPHPSPSSQ